MKRIYVTYKLRLEDPDKRSAVERVHSFHADQCPMARSIKGSVDISTSMEVTGAD